MAAGNMNNVGQVGYNTGNDPNTGNSPVPQGGGLYTPKMGSPTYVGQYLGQADQNFINQVNKMSQGGQDMSSLLNSYLGAFQGMNGATGYDPAQTTAYGNAMSANSAQNMGLANYLMNAFQGQAGNLISNPFAGEASGILGAAPGMAANTMGLAQQLMTAYQGMGQGTTALADQLMTGYQGQAQNVLNESQGLLSQFQPLVQQLTQGYQPLANAMLSQSMDPSLMAALGTGPVQAAESVLSSAFDPQQALYNRTQSQLQDQVRSSEAANGVAGTPYASAVEGNAMSNFNIDWQNQQLQRQLSGLTGAEGALKTGTDASNQMLQCGLATLLQPIQAGLSASQTGTNNAATLGNLGLNMLTQPVNAGVNVGNLGLNQITQPILAGAQVGNYGLNQLSTGINSGLSLLSQPTQLGLQLLEGTTNTGAGLMQALNSGISQGQSLAQSGPNFQSSLLSSLLGDYTATLNPTQTALSDLLSYMGQNQNVQSGLSQQNQYGTGALLNFISSMQNQGGSSGKSGMGSAASGIGQLGSALGGMAGK